MVHNFQFLESKANLQSHLQSNLRAKIYPGFFKEIFSLILYYFYFVQTTKTAGLKKHFLGLPGSLVIRTLLQGAQVQSPVEELRFYTLCDIAKKNPLLYQVSKSNQTEFPKTQSLCLSHLYFTGLTYLINIISKTVQQTL